uniref:Transglutaminase-like domain-containing protein n=1 Tax=Dunaliella tertiolecta TaxID=3047 RepID=A0A7S3QU05_DUNTE
MDLDELLARQLQHAELAEAPQAPSGGRTRQEQEKVQLLGAIESGLDLCSKCEDEELQALALSLIPLDELADSAKRTKQLNQQEGSNAAGGRVLDVQDYLACELMQWFKRSFFKWVNAPPCAFCGSKTTGAGVQPPNQEERAFQASRTEIYCCSVCSSITRFPRFNDVGKLLETRKGRCGEFANAALLCCRAIGLTARYIWDSEDHVWTEYWSDALQRWVHMDFCEAAWDKSLLYEGGWKKKLKYVLAICPTSVVDVTARYTRQVFRALQGRVVCCA